MMQIRKFVNREMELALLEDLHSRKGFRAVLIYGRRRVGKTFLIKRFLSGKRGLYFLCLRRSVRENVDNFTRVAASAGLPHIRAENIIQFFERMADYLDGMIIVLDEFQYLVEKDEGVLSDMQYVFDEILGGRDVMVILCGSSMGTVERMGADMTSPLYGRFSARLKVKKMRFRDVMEFHPERPLEEVMGIYGAVDGVPLYHESFLEGGFEENIVRNFFRPGSFLYDEAEFLLREELRDASTYMSILHSIAQGHRRVTEIANSIYMNAKDLPKYLSVLRNLEIVERVRPVNSGPRSRSSIYIISDRYFRFWFTFVEPFRAQIEFGEVDAPLQHFRDAFPRYMGTVAEEVLAEVLRSRYPMVGKWWHRGDEIDLVAVGKGEVLFCEVKWRGRKAGYRDYEELVRRSELVRGYEGYRRKYLIFSRSGFRDVVKLREEGVMLWDLRALERELRGEGTSSPSA